MTKSRAGREAQSTAWVLSPGMLSNQKQRPAFVLTHHFMRLANRLERSARYGALLVILILLAISLTACAQEESIAPTATAEATQTLAPVPTATPSPAPTLAPTPVPEATEIVPAITAGDQPLREDGQLMIAAIMLPQSGWVAVHNLREAQVAEMLAYAAVPAGASINIPVTIDPLHATPELVALLHVDAGEAGVFEFPGADLPWEKDGEAVSAAFMVEIQLALPSITIEDQIVTEEGLVRVDRAYTPDPGWLLIHADAAGAIGPLLGYAWLSGGVSEDTLISIRWRESTPRLYGVLYEDNGRLHRLDEAEDLPLLVGGQPVVVSFEVSLPPDIFVLDQPVVDGQVVIERVVSQGNSWLVIYHDDQGGIGRIVGYALLADGVNEQVAVDIVERNVTPNLHILLHEDAVAGDAFNFPAADRPLMYDGRLPAPISFRTDPGNYLITRDQELEIEGDSGTANVTIPLVVVDAPTWVIVRRVDVEGQEGAIIGMTWLPAGINRNVRVPVNRERVSEQLIAVLHLDAGTPGQFDFPAGSDVPLRYSRRVIQSPFSLLPEPSE